MGAGQTCAELLAPCGVWCTSCKDDAATVDVFDYSGTDFALRLEHSEHERRLLDFCLDCAVECCDDLVCDSDGTADDPTFKTCKPAASPGMSYTAMLTCNSSYIGVALGSVPLYPLQLSHSCCGDMAWTVTTVLLPRKVPDSLCVASSKLT